MVEKNIPKIRQNLDVKQRAVSGVKELKEYLYDRRGNLTQEEISVRINTLAEDLYTFFYGLGWEEAMETHRVRKSNVHTRIVKMFNIFYNEQVSKLPINTMEKIRFIVDVALLKRYFYENGTIDKQLNNREIY